MYKSKGDLVTGDPVNILLYFARLAILIIFLVLAALLLLIVVHSSIANKALWLFKNFLAKAAPLVVENASTFIKRM